MYDNANLRTSKRCNVIRTVDNISINTLETRQKEIAMEYVIYYINEDSTSTKTAHIEADTEADALAWFYKTHPHCEVNMCVPFNEVFGTL